MTVFPVEATMALAEDYTVFAYRQFDTGRSGHYSWQEQTRCDMTQNKSRNKVSYKGVGLS